MDELSRAGIVSQLYSDSIALISPAYIAHADDIWQVRILSDCVSDLFKTEIWNINSDTGEKRFPRQVTYNQVDESTAAACRAYPTTKATELIDCQYTFLAKKCRRSNKKIKGKSLRIGV